MGLWSLPEGFKSELKPNFVLRKCFDYFESKFFLVCLWEQCVDSGLRNVLCAANGGSKDLLRFGEKVLCSHGEPIIGKNETGFARKL